MGKTIFAALRYPTTSVRTLRLMHDRQCHCIWETRLHGGLDNLDPGDLPISSALADELRRWAASYEGTFNADSQRARCHPTVRPDEGVSP